MNILEQILATKREEIAAAKKEISMDEIEAAAFAVRREKLSFRDALENSESGIIAEFKRKSPSKGYINQDADACRIVSGYARSGAAAISVLTDEQYFGGSLEDLVTARPEADVPLLRKDFIVDPYQICQARIAGADCILLIAAALQPDEVADLAAYAHRLGLEVLLEIHIRQELDRLTHEVDVVGINNRDLATFVTDIAVSTELESEIPDNFVKISESGISSPDTVRALRKQGFRGFLMGENFMKEEDPASALARFIGEI